jgi:hypothetical protein
MRRRGRVGFAVGERVGIVAMSHLGTDLLSRLTVRTD